MSCWHRKGTSMDHPLGTRLAAAVLAYPEDPPYAAAALAALRSEGLVAAFTGRRGGASLPPFDEANISLSVGDRADAVLANRRQILTTIGMESAAVATVRQRHTATVVRVDERTGAGTAAADGM